MSVMREAADMPACLATNGSSLFLEPCVQDPAHCWERGPDCAKSLRVRQLWYSMKNNQLLSSFTSEFDMGCRAPVHAMPKCIATRPNGAPIRPPAPPAGTDPKLPLQVWAGPLSGGRLAVALANAGSTAAQIEASWSVLGIQAGTEMSIRDATAGTANGTATDSVSSYVASHDTVVLTLAPVIRDTLSPQLRGQHRGADVDDKAPKLSDL